MQASSLDWGVGRYETIAAQLSPAAEIVVAAAGLKSGDRVVDIGCGTGNAALLAARRGAKVTGIDPASRLIDVAAERAVLEGVQASFRPGEAASLPIPSASVDVAMSVFGVIFAADAAAAAAEIDSVLTASARVVLSAWLPRGAVFEMNAAAAAAVRAAVGIPPPPAFNWHDPSKLVRLLQPYGFTLSTEEHELAFTASRREIFLRSNPGTTRSRSPASGCSPNLERPSKCAMTFSRSSRRETRTQLRSARPAATSWPWHTAEPTAENRDHHVMGYEYN